MWMCLVNDNEDFNAVKEFVNVEVNGIIVQIYGAESNFGYL